MKAAKKTEENWKNEKSEGLRTGEWRMECFGGDG